MKLFFFAFICLKPVLSIAQTSYEVNAHVNKLKDGDKIYLTYQVEGNQITDSSTIQNGRFSFRGNIQYPALASLYLNRNPYVVKMQKGEVLDYMRFYLESSKITMESADSLKKMIVTGSISNVIYANLRHMLKRNDDEFTALRKEYDKLPKEKQVDSSILAGFISKEQKLLDESYKIHLDFANKNINSYLTVISLAHASSQPGLTNAVEKAYHRLPEQLKNTPTAKTIPILLMSHKATEIGKIAPYFEQQNPDGKIIKLSDFKGKYVLIDFWASWCAPCRKENPNLVAVYRTYKMNGFEILGVSLDNPGQADRWKKAIFDDGLIWAQVSDLRGWDNQVSKVYGVRSIPANYLIDPSGKIVAKDLRGELLKEKLAQIFIVK